jgi:hypothetical protein
MRKKTLAFIVLFSLSLLVLSACSGAGSTGEVVNTPLPATATPFVEVEPVEEQVVVEAPEAIPTEAASLPDPVEVVEDAAPGPTPTARPGLEATDPTGVSLVSGDPTLVEFFAFW